MKQHKLRIKRLEKSLKTNTDSTVAVIGFEGEKKTGHSKNYANLFYLTGIQKESCFLVVSTKNKNKLITRPPLPSLESWDEKDLSTFEIAESLNLEVIKTDNPLKAVLRNISNHETVVSEPNQKYTAEILKTISKSFRSRLPIKWINSHHYLNTLRATKDRSEIKLIKESARITKKVMNEAFGFIKPGVTEKDVYNFIRSSYFLKDVDIAFTPIVAAGSSSSYPHYRRLNKTIKKGNIVQLDIGCSYNNYCSDMSRVIKVEENYTEIELKIIKIIEKGFYLALKKCKPNASLLKINSSVKNFLAKELTKQKIIEEKFTEGDNFQNILPHGVSHHIGINVHDSNISDVNILKENMVITIEPALYFNKTYISPYLKSKRIKPNKIQKFGIRLEDTILITKDGAKSLVNNTPFY